MKSLQESLFDSKTQTMESLFDKDLTTKVTPIMLKYEFMNDIKSLYDKYGIKYEVHSNYGSRGTESIILFRDTPNCGLSRVFDFDIKIKGNSFKYYVYFRPEFVVPADKYVDDKSLWYLYPPDLWFNLKKEDGSNPSMWMQDRYNKFAEIESLSHDGKPGHLLSDKEAIKDCLDRLESSIFIFNSNSFKVMLDKLIDEYCKIGKPIPSQEVKRLADKL